MKTKAFFAIAMLGVATMAFAKEEPVVMATDGSYSISYDANGNAVGMSAPEHKLGQSGIFGRQGETSFGEGIAREVRNIRANIRRTLHFNAMTNDESIVSALSDEFSGAASSAAKSARAAGAELDRNINAEEASLDVSKGIVISAEAFSGPQKTAADAQSALAAYLAGLGAPGDWLANYGTDNGDGTYTFDYDALQAMWGDISGSVSCTFEDFSAYFGITSTNNATATINTSGTVTPGSGARCPVGEPIVLGLMAAGYAAMRRRKNEE